MSGRPPGVQPGYEIGRDEAGLTKREREVRNLLLDGLDQPTIGARLTLSKQRVNQIVKSLEDKKVLRRDPVLGLTVVRRPRGGEAAE